MTYGFSDRTVLVTGAGRGIGLELGRYFRATGANTYCIDIDEAVIGPAAD